MTILPQRIIRFYEDELVATQQNEGAIFVAFARLCENLRLARYSQVRRIQSHTILNEGFQTLTLQTDGGPQEAQCLRLDLLPLWLASLQANRIKDETVREKLVRYQREAAAVLWNAFKPQILIEEPPPTGESGLAIAQLEQIIAQSQAMQRMAEEQIALIRRMDKAALVVRDLQRDVTAVQVRLGVLEEQVFSSAITEEQAAEVALAVKTVAHALQQSGVANGYQRVYAELYRQQGITSYKNLPASKFTSVMAWLKAWHEEVSIRNP